MSKSMAKVTLPGSKLFGTRAPEFVNQRRLDLERYMRQV